MSSPAVCIIESAPENPDIKSKRLRPFAIRTAAECNAKPKQEAGSGKRETEESPWSVACGGWLIGRRALVVGMEAEAEDAACFRFRGPVRTRMQLTPIASAAVSSCLMPRIQKDAGSGKS
ncbi:hypothetical protein EVG20_g9574 [Dentipellis fragilis]|uniref:Uncharacterized protein n=1 Tax=Dentipellis fragilis TaxID=205917 RepID=A0A4Y9XYM0_9AGAM|nr:hypothetical protein EVG20_g9574 [Dentipellis fragilis]